MTVPASGPGSGANASNLLSDLSGDRKRAILIACDGVAMLLALWLAFSIRLGEFYWPRDGRVAMVWAAAVAIGLVVLIRIGTYRIVIRYMDVRAAPRLVYCAAALAAVWFACAYLSRVDMPRSVGFIYFAGCYILMFFGRMSASQVLSGPLPARRRSDRPRSPEPVGVVIYGANATGASLAASIRHQPNYKLRFFIDDDPALNGRMIADCPVRPASELREAIRSGLVEQVFLALPQSTRTERMAALSVMSGLSVKVMTIPSHAEIMRGRYTISDVRPLNVDDLLKRDVVPPLKHLLDDSIVGRSILVTGAGGSIGSELCRQILRCDPKRLVLFDQSEFALYAIEKELQTLVADDAERDWPEIVPVIGSLLNAKLLARTLKRFDIDTVFHAAAYKHVPLLEGNEIVGVENNVIGTKTLADACVAARVGRFTMVSTDKAVRPTNIMGSSKRIAELYIQALAQVPDIATRFGIVRFGNVLDSSGSVVQHFRSQIREGGPVTFTHPDVTRFFMSIPEATQLVLQAGALATGGEVFVLDMGEPIRIVDLARNMISLSGMAERSADNPSGDVEIRYIGLRPGEKLHEELFVGEAIGATRHPQINQAREPRLSLSDFEWRLRGVQDAIDDFDTNALRIALRDFMSIDEEARPRARAA